MPVNNNTSNFDFKTALIALAATAAGAIAISYAWDRMYGKTSIDDSQEWLKSKRERFSSESKTSSSSDVRTPKPLVSDSLPKSSNNFSQSNNTQKQEQQQFSSSSSSSVRQFNDNRSASSNVIEEKTTIQKQAPIVSGNDLHKKVETTVVAETIKKEVREAPADEHVMILEAEGNHKVREREAVVQEVIHPVQVEEIQPVIHRERKKTEVHQIIQPIYEEKMLAPEEQKRELIPEHKPTEYESRDEYKKAFEENLEESRVEYTEAKKIRVVKPAIIEEVIKTDIIDVIQPVIHRETIAPTIVHTTQPIFEKIKEQPTLIREVREPITLTSEELAALKSVTDLVIAEEEKVEEVVTTTTTTTVTTEVTQDVELKKESDINIKTAEIIQPAYSSSASIVSSK